MYSTYYAIQYSHYSLIGSEPQTPTTAIYLPRIYLLPPIYLSFSIYLSPYQGSHLRGNYCVTYYGCSYATCCGTYCGCSYVTSTAPATE